MALSYSISDEELRKKLNEYGISSPVTGTTRNVLLKKVNRLITADENSIGSFSDASFMNKQSHRVSSNTRSGKKAKLSAYSSDEEEDLLGNSRKPISSYISKRKSPPVNSKRYPVFRKSMHVPRANSYNRQNYDTYSDSETEDRSNETTQDGLLLTNNSCLNNNKNSLNSISQKSKLTNSTKTKNNTSNNENLALHKKYSTNCLSNGNNSPLYTMVKAREDSFEKESSYFPSTPIFLIFLVTIFFFFIGFCYISIHYPLTPTSILAYFKIISYPSGYYENLVVSDESNDEFDSNASENKFPICNKSLLKNCVTQEELEKSSKILGLLEKIILPALRNQASMFQCSQTSVPYLSLSEISVLALNELPMADVNDIKIGVKALAKLSSLNHHWGVRVVKDLETHSDEILGLGYYNPPTEIMCHIVSAIYALFLGIMMVCALLFGLWALYFMYKLYKKRKEDQAHKSFELVERILEILENKCGTTGKAFVAVNHVRDSLIPPRQRISKAGLWSSAVKFIDDHDSRVYREIRDVGGEDCEVWRWIPGAPRSPISCSSQNDSDADLLQPPEKIWQGHAFESGETGKTIPQFPPTPCLKIRNMFDYEVEFGDNWPRRIQDSLLEKCDNAAIVHVAVDRISKEGCVYLKCASAAEAGKAFKALHGSWFDGKLVTVKYLREERYYERFPTARLATSSLTPSNDKKLSLQELESLNAEIFEDEVDTPVTTRRILKGHQS